MATSPASATAVKSLAAKVASRLPVVSHSRAPVTPAGLSKVRVPLPCRCQSQKLPHGNSMNQCVGLVGLGSRASARSRFWFSTDRRSWSAR
eukprot:15616770-Heterocapsa_arctica.AAC.1